MERLLTRYPRGPLSMHIATKSVGTFEALKEKIESKTARVGIVGLGYVGLPLAIEFAKAGFPVTGIDVQQAKVDRLNRGESHVQDVPSSEVAQLVGEQALQRDHRLFGGARARHHQHLRAHAAAQDQRSRT